tara:strand:+ start:271 stop:396 length:126 start_codon:yes stop_codon:yes gene_type:complete
VLVNGEEESTRGYMNGALTEKRDGEVKDLEECQVSGGKTDE